MKLQIPVSYQGGKYRIAKQIVDVLLSKGYGPPYYDVCCGSGAVTIELINRGVLPTDIVMLDRGPWGEVWSAVGEGSFDIDRLSYHCKNIPSDRASIQSYIKKLSTKDVDDDVCYIYLILQAASFGGKALWIENNKWQNTSFRSFWQPTATSNRRSVVNPMMPMKDTLVDRMKVIVRTMLGVSGHCCDAESFPYKKGTVYIDPPYDATTGYGYILDLARLNRRTKCIVSEGRPLSDDHVLVSEGRSKGGISGTRTIANAEYLSFLSKGSYK